MAWIRRAATNVVNRMQRLRRRLPRKSKPTRTAWHHATNRAIDARFEELPEIVAASCRESRKRNTLRSELAKLKHLMRKARPDPALERIPDVDAKAKHALEVILETHGKRFLQAYEAMLEPTTPLSQAA